VLLTKNEEGIASIEVSSLQSTTFDHPIEIPLQKLTHQINDIRTQHCQATPNNRTKGNASLPQASRISFHTLKCHHIEIDANTKFDDNC
jgi:hypothetical protein